ncbi:hydroxyisourate hydrolase [Novosphingobium aerophilum]|uniref:hydroxyisourate hydrolase n=1 Tax=Novosphingobium TaxID=165696 RepID=UPI0010465CD9|nr:MULTISPECIES: hydroxyisourate hydrolase [unclassified Novosphingobium]MPS68565.1 hydroxyisourate hydrolase [Novosphingobium sp.]TCM36841.1 5-hydroxyisourate hydrolase [Novosphingobium sp. ST904]WRT93898.1 hydroxyisourate hydrolase [Novosphingobium sp. RL4]
MSTLSTHVLDTAHGCPAEGIALELAGAGGAVLFTGTTNADGRCPGIPALDPGAYRLTFAVAAYFRGRGMTLPEPPFLDRVSIDFGVADGQGHYHVPLLVSPFGYSTYRGS